MSNEIAQIYGELRARIEQPANDLRRDGKAVFIYGAGGVGRDVYQALTRLGVPVLGFLDRGATPGAAWQGNPIWNADDPTIGPLQRSNSRVVVAIHNAFVEVPPILENLRRLGYPEVVSFLELHDVWPDGFGDRFWLTRKAFYLETEAYCQATDQLWADEASRSLFRAALRFRFQKDYRLLPAPDVAHQYFDPTVCNWPAPLRFMDCGAFDGDTLAQLIKTQTPVQSILAFEPDGANFSKLCQFAASHRNLLPKDLYLYPCGVDAETCQVRFSGGCGASGHLSALGESVIQCVSIDQVAFGFAPSLIKMDIEGAELAALRGAQATIIQHRPGLAICVYHRPEHLWQIPALVSSWYGRSAKYFLRSHGYNDFDLVFYAVPE